MVWQQENRLSYEDFLDRHGFIVVLFVLIFSTLSIRLFFLQIIEGRFYKNISEQQRTHLITERAPRGKILDCSGEVIAGTKTSYVAIFYPFSQNVSPPQETIDRLGTILEDEKLVSRLANGWRTGQSVRLAKDLKREDMFRLMEQRLMLPGISVVKEARRNYLSPLANSHLVGYLGEVARKELDNMSNEEYKMGDWVGKGGLEKYYDNLLRGQDGGWQIEVDAYGRQIKLVKHIPYVPGDDIYTTIDSKLQEVAIEALSETSTQRGAVVGIDPRDGSIRILVSSPGYDPNLSTSQDFGKYLKDKSLPLFNRAIQALYSPGSTFKIVTFIGALAENKVEQDQTFVCTGSFSFGNKTFKCWNKKGHGRVALKEALAKSCNVYFYQLGLKVGPKILQEYSNKFGLGKVTGIESFSEKSGLVPTEEWKQGRMHDSWHPGDTINMAIGQGPLWVSPAQMASLIATVANRGKYYQLHMVDKIVSPDGDVVFKYKSKIKGNVVLPDQVWGVLIDALTAVVSNGTAGVCYFPDLEVAGKTGTAQNPAGKDHAWFVAFAPVKNPELALAVIVENGGSGGAVAAPIARRIFEQKFNIHKKEIKVVPGEPEKALDQPEDIN